MLSQELVMWKIQLISFNGVVFQVFKYFYQQDDASFEI